MINSAIRGDRLLTVSVLCHGQKKDKKIIERRRRDFSHPLTRGVRALLITALLFSGSLIQVYGQSTYTWKGANNGAWGTGTNWTPTRTIPAADDILQFNTGTTLTVTGLPNQTIGNLLLSNNTKITLDCNGNKTLTVGNGAGTDLDIPSGSSLTLIDGVGLTLPAGATTNIDGSLDMSGRFLTIVAAASVNITGTLSNSATINIAGVITNSGTCINSGTISNSGIFTNNSTGTITNSGTITNNATGIITQAGTLNNSGTLTVSSGTTTVSGTIVNSGNVTGAAGYLTFESGGTYQHAQDGGNIPTASWDVHSTCLVTGVTYTIPTIASFNQAFGNVTWKCASQMSTESFAAQLTTVNGDLTINNTGSGSLNLMLGGGSGSYPTVVAGNFIQTGGTFYLLGDDYNSGAKTMEVKGDFSVSGGTFDVDGNFTYGSSGTLYVGGNFTLSSGATFTESGYGSATLNFNGTGSQLYTSAVSLTNNINVVVSSGATLQMGTGASPSILNGNGTFTLLSGGTLGITSVYGITRTTTGATAGSIQMAGTRTYSAGASYIYNGTSAQVTGDGLMQNNTPADLTINNPAGVTLTATINISGLLTMSSGTLKMATRNITAGSLTGSSDIAGGSGAALSITIGSDNTSPAAYSGLISNAGATSVTLTKVGTGLLTLANPAYSYNGVTTITGGELRLNPTSTSATFASQIVLNGGTLGTYGIAANSVITFSSTLNLKASSTISLGSNSHSIHFPNSSGTAWTGGTLTISNWGSNGGHVFFGSDATGLSGGQLSKISFSGYPGGASFKLPATGEIVPPTSTVSINSASPASTAGPIKQGSTNNVVYSFSANAPSGNAVISGLQINTTGSYSLGDISGLKVWYSANNSFDPGSDVLLSTMPFPSAAGTHVFPDWKNQSISGGSTGYFFITADVACAGTAGATITVSAINSSDVSFYGTVTCITSDGGEQSIEAVMLLNVTGVSASAGDTKSVLNWTAPANCYDEILIVARVNTLTGGTPSDDGSAYTANLVYESGSAFPGGGYVVYKGSTAPQTVTGLANGLTYYFTFFTRKGKEWSVGLTRSVTTIAAKSGDYQSANSSNWGTYNTWLYYDGYRWYTPTATEGLPTNNSGRVTVLYGNNVTVAASVNVDQVTVDAGAQVNVATGVVLTVRDGTDAVDCNVNGTIYNQGTITATAGVLGFNSGSVYQHAMNGGAIPTATWDPASACYITGIAGTAPTIVNQSYGNFTWDCSGQTNATISLAGNLRTVNGSFTVVNTGAAGKLTLGLGEAGALTIAGDYIQTGGSFAISSNKTNFPTAPAAARTMTVNGNFSLTGASSTFDLTNSTTAGNTATLFVKGNFTHTSGTLTETGATTASSITFNGTGTQQLYASGGTVSNIVNFNVSSPAYLQMAEEATKITGAGTFTLSSGATLGITSASGITSSGAIGNIQVTGTRTFNTGSNYIYNSSGVQTSGTGLPSAVNKLTLSGASTNLSLTSSPLTITTELTTDPETNLNIGATQVITTNAFTNNGTIVINSTSLTQSGSMIATGTLTQSGTVTYNRQLRTEAGYGDYQYISSPVASNTATNSSFITAVYGWDEVAGSWPTTSMTALVSGRGYNLDQTSSSTGLISFTGSLANSVSIPATSPYSDNINGTELNYNSRTFVGSGGHSGVVRSIANYGGGGWNLLGNPFTSAILVSSFISANSTAFDPNYMAVYLYDPSVGTKGTYYYIGNSTGWSTGLSQTHIQAGQGFFVMAMNDYATFNLTRSMQEHATADAVLKSTKSEERWPGLRIKAKLTDVVSYTTIVFNNEMTLGLDPGYDIGEMSSYPAIDIYSTLKTENGLNYMQQALPSSDIDSLIIPIGVDCAAGGEVTFSAETEPLDGYNYLLEDRKNGTITDLSNETYTTVIPATTCGTGRFFFRLKKGTKTDDTPTPEDPNLLNVRLWSDDNIVYVKGNVSEKAIATVYDMQGHLVYENYLTEGSYNSFPVPNASKGIYIVRITDGSKAVTKKVALR
jgi:hypothetical protein